MISEAISELQEIAGIFVENFYAYFLELTNAADSVGNCYRKMTEI
jgi:hypothetical protein